MEFLLGNEEILENMPILSGKEPFSPEMLEFCGAVSKELMRASVGRNYPDIITLGFWLRKGSIETFKRRFLKEDGNIHLGRGVVFHVAPSNVPINFAYSLFAGLLCGNANIVRVPSRDFPQVFIVVDSLKKVLGEYPEIAPYVVLVRYGHEQEVNDRFSSLCDVRIIWGGDAAIAEIRKSFLPPRASEVTFADRFSLSVIDAAVYSMMNEKEKEKLAKDFYNDTYLTDQNACTSPRAVVWLNNKKDQTADIVKARTEFWTNLWRIVEKEYTFQNIQGVNKLTKKYLLAANEAICVKKSRLVEAADNRLVCVEIGKITDGLSEYFDNAGYFLEYITDDISDLSVLCKDNRCQTIGYVGEKSMFTPLLWAGGKGIDRVVPIGKTMDFDLIWDGYDLTERLTRTIAL